MRGLSDRDIQSPISEAGLGQITRGLRERYRVFRARGPGEVELPALFCDAIYLPTRMLPRATG